MEKFKQAELEREINSIERHLRNAGFESGRYADYRMETWISQPNMKQMEAAVYQYAQDVNGGKRNWLYLCGGFGSGKTHIAVALARQIAFETMWKPEICRWSEYCSRIQASWKGQADVSWGKMNKARLLVVDDVDKRQATEWAIGQLYEMIEHRYVFRLPTIITANRKLSELAQAWAYDARIADTGKAIISRIVGQIVGQIEFNAPDYRMKPEGGR